MIGKNLQCHSCITYCLVREHIQCQVISRLKNYRFSQHKAIELNLWFNKVMLFPLKQLLQECLTNRDRVPAHIKGLLVSWTVCNENLGRLHQSGRSIRPVSSHYPIRVRCVRVQCGQLKLILCPLGREGKKPDRKKRLKPSVNTKLLGDLMLL